MIVTGHIGKTYAFNEIIIAFCTHFSRRVKSALSDT